MQLNTVKRWYNTGGNLISKNFSIWILIKCIFLYTQEETWDKICYKSVLTQKESHVEDEPGFKVRVKRKNQHKAKMVLSVALHHRHQNWCIFATMFIEAVLALKCNLCLSVKNTHNNKGITITETNNKNV